MALDIATFYNTRSSSYDNSWHPRFARHIIQLASLTPGEHVLDLACGTGLVTFAASEAVTSSGSVIGVDISSGMLEQAHAKQRHHQLNNVEFYQHSITELDGLRDGLERRKGTYDVVICASALVLLPNPIDTLRQWTSYLKPGGRLIVDVPHPNNIVSGVVFERVGSILQKPIMGHRANFSSEHDLQRVMEEAGLANVTLTPVAQLSVPGTEELRDYLTTREGRLVREYEVGDAGRVFDEAVEREDGIGMVVREFGQEATREEARRVFVDQWAEDARHDKGGKVREVDCVFVGMGWKG